jgi:hypothetical protein
MCKREAIGAPSMLRLTRIAVALVNMLPTFDLNWGQFHRGDHMKKKIDDFVFLRFMTSPCGHSEEVFFSESWQ